MQTLESLHMRVVTDKNGRQYSLNMSDMAIIQSKIDIEKSLKPFISVWDTCMFCRSAQGIDLALHQAAKRHDPSVTIGGIVTSLNESDRYTLVTELINSFWPANEDGDESGQEADPHVPLADPKGTGS